MRELTVGRLGRGAVEPTVGVIRMTRQLTDAEREALKEKWERLGMRSEIVITKPTFLRRLAIRIRVWAARRLEAHYA
jgi:hypothetical protein